MLIWGEATEVPGTLWWPLYIAKERHKTNAFLSLPEGIFFLFGRAEITD